MNITEIWLLWEYFHPQKNLYPFVSVSVNHNLVYIFYKGEPLVGKLTKFVIYVGYMGVKRYEWKHKGWKLTKNQIKAYWHWKILLVLLEETVGDVRTLVTHRGNFYIKGYMKKT